LQHCFNNTVRNKFNCNEEGCSSAKVDEDNTKSQKMKNRKITKIIHVKLYH